MSKEYLKWYNKKSKIDKEFVEEGYYISDEDLDDPAYRYTDQDVQEIRSLAVGETWVDGDARRISNLSIKRVK